MSENISVNARAAALVERLIAARPSSRSA